jgi:hypothetical protein
MAGYFKECFMLKKKIIFGSVVLFLAALFALTGCSQATDGGTTYLVAENHLYGTATADDVARAVASAQRTNRAVVLTDQLQITGPGGTAIPATLNPPVASFEDRPVRVEGSVTVTGNVIVNGAFADLSFEEGASITVTSGGAFIYSGTQDNIYTDTGNTGYKVKYVANPLEAAQGTDERIAVPTYKLWTPVAAHVTYLYVLGKTTVDSLSDAVAGTQGSGKPRIVALKEVDLSESNSNAFLDTLSGANTDTGFIFASSATLISSAPGAVTIGLPASAKLPAIKAEKPIVVTTSASPAEIVSLAIAKIEGPETVTIQANSITAALGLNNVTESGKVAVDVPTLSGTIGIVNAGLVDITGATISGSATTIAANSGTINITAGTTLSTPITIPATTTNTGTINISNTGGAISGAVNVIGSNSGLISFSGAAISGGVSVASNVKDLIFAVPSITTTAITVTRNESAGNITFSKPITGLGTNLIVVPTNYGAINFLGDLTATGLLGGTTPTTAIAGIGKVVFGGAATLATGTIIDCDVVLSGGLTLSGTMVFGGNVTLPYGQSIAASSANKITLKAGKTIQVGAIDPIPVLAAGSKDAEITPDGNAKLSAIAKVPDDDEDLNDRTLHLTNASGVVITAFTNNLIVKSGGILSVERPSGITVGGTSTLTLEDGAILAIPAAGTAYSVALGTTATIGGVTPASGDTSQLIASNGPVTLTANSLSGRGSTLAVSEEGGNATISVLTTTNLEITGVNLDLSLNGSLVIPSPNTTRVTLVGGGSLVPPGRITLSDDVSAEPATYTFGDYDIATDATIAGTGVLRADDVTGPVGIQDLAADPGSNVVISGGSGSNTIEAGISVNLP